MCKFLDSGEVQQVSIVDTTKDIYELIKKGADIEMQEKLMRLREEALEIQNENHELRQRVAALEAELAVGQEMKFDGTVYWRTQGDQQEGPYCQQCFDNERKLIRLQQGGGGDWGRVWWDCHTCKSRFDERS